MLISFAQQILVTYYEPGISSGTGDAALTKTGKKKKNKQIPKQTTTTKNNSSQKEGNTKKSQDEQ